MHGFDETAEPAGNGRSERRPWYAEMNRYHWFVLAVAALGWLFDCLDQQLFVLARPAAMKELVAETETLKGQPLEQSRRFYGDVATSIFLAGWAAGGLFFGILGDRIGRAKTMLITILIYSICTGLSALSVGPIDFAIYRFLTGLGVGGEFAVGVALVAEVMPSSARTWSLALLQALSAIGNVSAALINLGLGVAEEQGMVTSPWRWMFVIGAVPALLAIVIRRHLKEPVKWQQASHEGAVAKQLGSYRELFSDPVLRRNAIVGLLLACSGVIGLWAVGFFAPDLVRYVQTRRLTIQICEEQAVEARREGKSELAAQLNELGALYAGATKGTAVKVPDHLVDAKKTIDPVVNGRLTRWQSLTSIMINVGAFCGIFGFGFLAQGLGRRTAFAIALVAAYASTVAVFFFLNEFWQIFVLVPLMGFCQLSLFGGYAIYFPELFPTRLRSTGTSFCYNVGRFAAALGPLVKSQLEGAFAHTSEPLRFAGIAMASVFLIGLLVLPFAPETKGKPLPD